MNAKDLPQASEERLYRGYRQDRADGMTHQQIVADGVYGALAEPFCLRYDLAQAAYVDAAIQADHARRQAGSADSAQYSTFGQRIREGQ